MAYTDPNDWSAPKTDSGEPPSVPTHGNDGMGTGEMWTPADGIATTDLSRIETNIKGLHTLLCQSGTVNVVVNNPYFTANLIRMWNWVRINNIVFLGIREMTSAGNTANDELQINPVTVWPTEILPTDDTIVKCIFQKNQMNVATPTYRPGFFIMPSVNNAAAICYITCYDAGSDSDGCYCIGSEVGKTGFSDGNVAGNKKSIPSQTVMYMTDREILSGTTTSTTPAP